MTNISKCLKYNDKFMINICNKYTEKHFQLQEVFENIIQYAVYIKLFIIVNSLYT